MFIVVDDERTFDACVDITYLRNEDEAMLFLSKWWNNNLSTPYGGEVWIDQIWFDHDLGPNGGNGLNVAKFFARLILSGIHLALASYVDEVYVHSQNPVGAEAIYRELYDRLTPHEIYVTRVALPALI